MADFGQAVIDEGRERGYQGVTVPRAIKFLSSAHELVCGWEAWPFTRQNLATTLAADGTVPAQRVRSVHALMYGAAGSERKLDWIPPGHAARLYPGYRGTSPRRGTPCEFTIVSDFVYTLPAGANGDPVRLDYSQRPEPFTNGGLFDPAATALLVPASFTSVVVDAWVLEAAKDQHDWDTVAAIKRELYGDPTVLGDDGARGRMIEALIDPQVSDYAAVLPLQDIYE